MTLGCFCSLPTSTNQRRRLKICKSSEFTSLLLAFWNYLDIFFIMARNVLAKDQFVKLIVGAGQASPSPPVGPALGSKGVKSMDFCKVGLCLPFTFNTFAGLNLSLCMYINYLTIGIQCPHSSHQHRCSHPRACHCPS